MRGDAGLDQGDGRESSSDWSHSRIIAGRAPRFAAGLDGHKKEREVMSTGILDDGIPITEMGDCRKNMFVWENQEFRLGHVKCEMSINIQVEMLRRQMEAQVRSVVQGRGWAWDK